MLKLNKFLIKIYIVLYNNLYHKISKISTKLNNGIHPKHRLMDYHKFFIDNIRKNSKVLDIGCGIGSLTYDIAKKARKVIGIDINRDFIKIAKSKFNRVNIKYLIGDATKYEFQDHYDYVILSNIFEHVKNRKSFLNNLKKITNVFLIRVPLINRSWLSLYTRELGLDYRLDRAHYVEYTIESFEKEIKSANLKILVHTIQFGEIWAVIESNFSK